MDVTGDDLAGVVDLFGGLTRTELQSALEELAFKRGDDRSGETFAPAIEDALDSYHLVAVADGPTPDPLLVAGPVAFPTLPDGATDLPHIMDVPDRKVDEATASLAARSRLEADAERAIDADDRDRIETLLDVSYDLDTWGGVDASDVRDRLERARE